MENLSKLKKNLPIFFSQSNPFQAIQTAVDQAMSSFYRTFNLPYALDEFSQKFLLRPAIDIVEDKEKFKVEVEMPGISEADVKVSISDHTLTISAEKETSRQDQDKNYISREISYGSYQRSILLPETVDTDKAKATFKKGMLWVELPKKAGAEENVKKINVEKVEDKPKG